MEHIDPVLKDAIAARQEGRNDEALRLLVRLFGQPGSSDTRTRALHFMTMFEWEQLAEGYPPARDALAAARDKQVARLLGGDENFGAGGDGRPRSRFQVVVGMNETLRDAQATYQLFVQLESRLPALARREAFLALPAIVEAGDFALAERYLADPLGQLEYLNLLARDLPLFPPLDGAPRVAILAGLGRDSEAEALRNAALAGIECDQMRSLAQRELAASGTTPAGSD